MRTAIIGLGIMGRRMLEHMNRHPGYKLVSMWDPNTQACDDARSLAPDVPVAVSAEQALAAADLVYLACPPIPRHGYALAALQDGKALFLEKPLGVDVSESERLVDACKSSGLPVAVNFTQAAGAALTSVSEATRNGALGEVMGVDIVVTYAAWPRDWQKAADWLRLKDEGGMTREVISHFLFFSERILGPLSLVWARPSYPSDPQLCETHLLARLENADGVPVTVMASVGGAQPDRQELTVKGTLSSRRITDFYVDARSNGGPFEEIAERPSDPRAVSLRAQLDDLLLCVEGRPNRLATPDEALRVQKLVEGMLRGQG
jgi:predicted dehydrogenase